METKDGYDYWEYKTYKLLSMVLTDKYQAVYAIDDDEGEGMHLEAYPLEALGIARVARHFVRRRTGDTYGKIEPVLPDDVYGEVVGLELCDGDFEIANESCSFGGICKIGDDISKAVAYLEWGFRSKLPGESRKETA